MGFEKDRAYKVQQFKLSDAKYDDLSGFKCPNCGRKILKRYYQPGKTIYSHIIREPGLRRTVYCEVAR